jgi:hypothetical protein
MFFFFKASKDYQRFTVNRGVYILFYYYYECAVFDSLHITYINLCLNWYIIIIFVDNVEKTIFNCVSRCRRSVYNINNNYLYRYSITGWFSKHERPHFLFNNELIEILIFGIFKYSIYNTFKEHNIIFNFLRYSFLKMKTPLAFYS